MAHLIQMLNSTIVRAHCLGSGRRRRRGSQALGRSRGGFTTKIHAKSDASGGIIAFDLTGGEASDARHFETLLDMGPDVKPRVALGDKGYSSKANRTAARKRGIAPVIPHKANERDKPAFFPKTLYKARARIEQDRTAQTLQTHRPALRENQTQFHLGRKFRGRAMLDQIRPHGLNVIEDTHQPARRISRRLQQQGLPIVLDLVLQ